MATLLVRVTFAAELGGGSLDVHAPVHAAVAWIKEHVADAPRTTATDETAQSGTAKAAATATSLAVPAPAAAASAALPPLDSSQLQVHILAASGARRPASDAEALSLCARWASGPAAAPSAASASAPALLQLHVTSSLLAADALAQVHLQLRGDAIVPSSVSDDSDLTGGYLSASAGGAAALAAFGPASCWSVIAVPGGDRTVLLRNTLTQQFLVADVATTSSGTAVAAAAAAPVPATTAAVTVRSSVTLTQRCLWRLISRGNEPPADDKAGQLGESLGYYIELARSGAAAPPLYLSACASVSAAAVAASPATATGSSSVSPITPLQCVSSLRRASAFDICPRLLCGVLRERTSHALAVPPAPGFFVLLNRRLLCFGANQAFNPLESPAVEPIIAATPVVSVATAPVAAAVAPAAALAGDGADAVASGASAHPPPTQMVHVHIPLGHEVDAPAPAVAAATATATVSPLSVSVPSDSDSSNSGSGSGSNGSSIPLHLARRIYPLQLLQSFVVEADPSAAQGQILRLSFPALAQRGPSALLGAGGAKHPVAAPTELFLHVQLSNARTMSPSSSPAPSPTGATMAAAAAGVAAATGPASPRSPSPAPAPVADVDPSAWRWRSALESELRRSPAVPASACVALESLAPPVTLAAAAAAPVASPTIAAATATAPSADAAALAELREEHALLSARHASLHSRAHRSESLLLLLASECASTTARGDDLDLRVGGLSPAHCRALSSIERSFSSLGRSSHLAQVALKQTQIEFLVQQLRDAQDRCNSLQEQLQTQALSKTSTPAPTEQQSPQDASSL